MKKYNLKKLLAASLFTLMLQPGVSLAENLTGPVGIGTTDPHGMLDVFFNKGRRLVTKINPAAQVTLSSENNKGNPETLRINADKFLVYNGINSGSLTQSLSVDRYGNVGIGTTSPVSKLDVAGSVRAETICDEYGNNCKDISEGWEDGNSGPFANDNMAPDNSIYINALSNIGIGTQSPNQGGWNADKIMTLTGGDGDKESLLEMHNSNPDNSSSLGVIGWTGDITQLAAIQGMTDGEVNSGLIKFSTANQGTLTERMRITKDGNIGMGVTKPHGRLDVGDVTDPVEGSCPEGYTHVDHDSNSVIDSGECWRGMMVSEGNIKLSGNVHSTKAMNITADGDICIGKCD
jgi:hypothetical protein